MTPNKEPLLGIMHLKSFGYIVLYGKLKASKLKAFADDKINVTQMFGFVFDGGGGGGNIVGKGENAG